MMFAFPQLRQLAWQVGTDTRTPVEALDSYERNQHHLDMQAIQEVPEALLWQKVGA